MEKAFEERSTEQDFIEVLAEELVHRQTERARRLEAKVRSVRLRIGGDTPTEHAAAEDQCVLQGQEYVQHPSVDRVEAPMPLVTNVPIQILGAWAALEVLNPQTFGSPHELASKRERALVADFNRGLPWEIGDRGRRDKKIFYHVVLGTIDAARAFAALLDRYVDSRSERPRVKAEAVLASVIVDKNGVLVPDDPVVVSSFAWGLPVALTSDLSELAGWSSVVERLQDGLAKQLRRSGSDGKERPLDHGLIQGAYHWLLSELRLSEAFVRPPRFAIRVFQDFRLRKAPDALLLNSFYLGDLSRAQACFARGDAPRALQLYIGQEKPPIRRDLLRDSAALEDAVAPSSIPSARWPGPGRHPLVLLQQAAVNLALDGRDESGVVAVNGPPGTGKTTLLRDVVAALVTRRAEAMCSFDDPARAFSDSGQRLKLGSESANLYGVNRDLKGFEILVASSNNGAVENISAELPAQSAVASDAGLSYFKALAEELIERPAWGLIAGVLGNASNRARFARKFWWDQEVGLATYLAEAAGTPQWIEEVGQGGAKIRRRPRLVVEASAPSSHSEALKRWEVARAVFRQRSERVSELLSSLEEVRYSVQNLPELAAAASSSRVRRDAASTRVAQLEAGFREALSEEATADIAVKRAQEELTAHDARRPWLLARVFRTVAARRWIAERELLAEVLKIATASRVDCKRVVARLEGECRVAMAAARELALEAEASERAFSAARSTLDEGRARLGDRLVDSEYFERAHDVRHQSVPWCDSVAHQARDELFAAAMEVHKAFIDAAAKPIRSNLAGLMKAMGTAGSSAFGGAKAPLLEEVWATLFLVVPVVSTTFASVERMLGALPPESLGWLLIDEAGQAIPQAAVGAILRCRKAIVVGDPVQIEPVVPLPESLTQTICRRFGVDPDHFNAPEASAQTLADAATSYMAEFLGRQGSRTVGVPLLVHRRCADPMFGVANAVAYQHLMVHAKEPKPSEIANCLGPSRWIDVQGAGHDKWCAQEGEVVLELLRKLADAGASPDLYIISPFRMVESSLSRLLLDSGVLASMTEDPGKWVRERVGTVHTAQGREAEAVIFVLGAPEQDQRGARGWAGGRPNLLNVALTRAQEVVYVVGNRKLWREAGVFGDLHSGMP
ncbi:DEAD/DEAH box helicase [Marilutibacter maris]|uniref:DEAD/DEAH box helicase n=1 Tax=Marilutibacter maris TaxID=1605891 RepID=UPI00147848FA|nr:AAA domain-containing protein [Lysobacter maris]